MDSHTNRIESDLAGKGEMFVGDKFAAGRPDLKNPQAVLSLLETDQVVATKQRTRFGSRTLSWRTRLVLWSLRIYVVLMLLLVLVSIFRVIHATP